MSTGIAARRAAYRAVRRVHEQGSWASPAVSTAISGLSPRDRGFAANLAFQTLRWEGTLDWALSHVLRRSKVEAAVRDVLRLGAWQIGYGGTPARAAVDTSVELAREVVGNRVSGFVNGVLRALARQWDTLPWPDEATDEGLGLRLGYPAWIVAEARHRFGAEAAAVLEAGNEPPGLTLRAADPDALASELRAEGFGAVRGLLATDAVRVPGADPSDVRAVAEGRAIVQDEASMLVCEALLAMAGDRPRVLDACAGPGGKAGHLATRGATVFAGDLHPTRARLVSELAGRLGVDVAVVAADGKAPPWRHGSFDAVLLDVPCTGLGVVRRRPELRWRRAAADVGDLARTQETLVEAAIPLLAPGGMLLYSACTWTVAETTGMVAAATSRLGLEAVGLPSSLPGPRADEGPGLQLRPDQHGTDGMYLVCLKRGLTMPKTQEGGREQT